MQRIPEPEDTPEIVAELALDRLRGRTQAVVAAVNRLHDEAERTIALIKAREETAYRLRPPRTDEESAAPVSSISSIPPVNWLRDSLQEIAAGAHRLAEETERVRQAAERHADQLRGTGLGYEARDATTVITAFVGDLMAVTASPKKYEPSDVDSLQRLAIVLSSAVTALGADYSPDADGRRRLRGQGGSARNL